MTDIGVRLNVQWPTLVRVLDGLEKDGLISRIDNPRDGRSRLVSITDAGKAMVQEIKPVIDDERASLLEGLSDEDLSQCVDVLQRLLERTRATEPLSSRGGQQVAVRPATRILRPASLARILGPNLPEICHGAAASALASHGHAHDRAPVRLEHPDDHGLVLHLKGGMTKPLMLVISISWGIAFFEYCFAVPANRLGYASGWSGAQLKIAQEAITLTVFAGFMILFLNEPLQWRHLGAALCLMGAVAFLFWGKA